MGVFLFPLKKISALFCFWYFFVIASEQSVFFYEVTGAFTNKKQTTGGKNMKQAQKKGLVWGLALLSLVSATAVMAEDKVVVVPLGSRQLVAKSGQTLRGQLDCFQQRGGESDFGVAGASYPLPLPSGTSRPILEVTSTTSTHCQGIGQAAPGYLCVYTYNTSNLNKLQHSGLSNGDNRLYGFSLDVFFNNTDQGWLLSSWAYTIP